MHNAQVKWITLTQNIAGWYHQNDDPIYYVFRLGKHSQRRHPRKSLISASSAPKVQSDADNDGFVEDSALKIKHIFLQHHKAPFLQIIDAPFFTYHIRPHVFCKTAVACDNGKVSRLKMLQNSNFQWVEFSFHTLCCNQSQSRQKSHFRISQNRYISYYILI